MSAERAAQLSTNLNRLRSRIANACAAVGRTEVPVLIAVTKTYPSTDVDLLAGLGVTDVGENRVDELRAKHSELQPRLRWHYLGRIQSRQVGPVAACADVVHSVDRTEIVTKLGRAVSAANRQLDVCVQLSLDGDPQRGGVTGDEIDELADAVAVTAGLRLAGMMAVPPIGADPAAAYDEVAAAWHQLRTRHPGADMLSAGMSADLEAAVAAGATHLRVGTALLGARKPLVG